MFDRFIRFAEARKALKKGQFEHVLRISEDPLLRGQRKTEDLREAALRGLLERAQRRADEGALGAAWTDVDRVLAIDSGRDAAVRLRKALREQLDAEGGASEQIRRTLTQARELAEAGDLAGARSLLDAISGAAGRADVESLRALVEGRAQAAGDWIERGRAALRSGDADGAQDALEKARAQDGDVTGGSDLARAVARKTAAPLIARARELQRNGDVASAFRLVEREIARLPELAEVDRVRDLQGRSGERWTKQARQLLEAGDLDEVAQAFRAADPRLLEASDDADLRDGLGELCRALELRDGGDLAGASECLNRARGKLPGSAIRRLGKELGSEAQRIEQAVAQARELAAQGDIVEARRRLLVILEKWPMQESVRREMEILDQGAHDKEQRLARARRLAKEGKLAEASALTVSLAVAGAQGEDARLLLKDLQARKDLVDRGLDQVRRAVHGRDSASAEGLRHCLQRLEQLEKVWCDHAELEQMRDALRAELAGLELLIEANESIAAGRSTPAQTAIVQFRELQPKFLRPDRLDARLLELVDRVQGHVEAAVRLGRLTTARAWLSVLEPAARDQAGAPEDYRRLLGVVDEREIEAEQAARSGLAALEQRELDSAQACLEQARAVAVDIGAVRRLEEGLDGLRAQEADLAEVERLAARADFGAAQQKLSDMPPTPPMLRTRIFDLKQNLARAQGLDHGFLLRVDEGGEFLVLRSDSVSIGNVREGTADLAVLASVAGRHARIQRSLSFHGGMQDKIVAERGEIAVRGRTVRDHALRNGDRIRLGATFEIEYAVPSSRSLTAMVTLRGGHQVSGTDKILLMKDRGRDGRILIGSTKDAHVRVPHAGPVEIFASNDGQIRVRCEGSGEMGGQPFSGEHPVTAGAMVRCGDISFVLQPLTRGA